MAETVAGIDHMKTPKVIQRLTGLILIMTLLLCCQPPQPAVYLELPALFGDHMVLQRDVPLPVWGRATPGGLVTVQFRDQIIRTFAGEQGHWRVLLKPVKAGGPFTLHVIGRDTLTLKDVLVGEVWLCSGQSNMEMPLAGWGKVLNYEDEISRADYPDMRLFTVKRTMRLKPVQTINTDGWKRCAPQTVADFSASAYFFGRELHQSLNVPIGLVHSSWGGTIIEAWMSTAALDSFPEFKRRLQNLRDFIDRHQNGVEKEEDRFILAEQAWDEEVQARDRGLNDPGGRWSEVDLGLRDWKTMTLPTVWEEAGLPGLDGVVWFRKEINLPRFLRGRRLTLQLGPVDDVDSTYFNGVLIGGQQGWNTPRTYTVPGELVRAGKNVITVRVRDNRGNGGIWGDPDQLRLSGPGRRQFTLAGQWQYRVGLNWNELTTPTLTPGNPNYPTQLSNGMIEPLIPFALRGAIWYQGESNAGRAYQYRRLFPVLIRDWRQRWQQGDFPFLFVQLANFMAVKEEPGEDSWAELREAQLLTLRQPNTAMAVAIDIGDAEDIHPKNKQEVGRRLALGALRVAYDKKVIHSGPIYHSMQREGNTIRLLFDYVGEGLVIKNGPPLLGFAIAGADRQFRWAKAELDGNEVVVWHEDIPNPVAVRYAWTANPRCNLYNSAGLPASPFRTDDWPGITGP